MTAKQSINRELGQKEQPQLSLNILSGRQALLERTLFLIEKCQEQVESKKPVGTLKQSWIKTQLYAVQVAASLIKDNDLDEIRRRIDFIESVQAKNR